MSDNLVNVSFTKDEAAIVSKALEQYIDGLTTAYGKSYRPHLMAALSADEQMDEAMADIVPEQDADVGVAPEQDANVSIIEDAIEDYLDDADISSDYVERLRKAMIVMKRSIATECVPTPYLIERLKQIVRVNGYYTSLQSGVNNLIFELETPDD